MAKMALLVTPWLDDGDAYSELGPLLARPVSHLEATRRDVWRLSDGAMTRDGGELTMAPGFRLRIPEAPAGASDRTTQVTFINRGTRWGHSSATALPPMPALLTSTSTTPSSPPNLRESGAHGSSSATSSSRA